MGRAARRFLLVGAVILMGAWSRALAGGATDPLQYANLSASGYQYRLPSLARCEVGDALVVVKNVGEVPVRLVSLSLLFSHAEASAQRTTFEVYSFRRGTFTGQLANTFDLASLRLGKPIGSGAGAQLWPLATKGLWYVVVARVQVVADHDRAWAIEGLGVNYDAGSKSYDQLFSQRVDLPVTTGCH